LFASKNLTNIWAGIGAGRWAISEKAAALPNVQAAAKRLSVGSLGLFYCTEAKGLTTPFIILSSPDAAVVVNDIWPERWRYPFSIRPFGTPLRILGIDRALSLLPTLQKVGKSRWVRVLHFQATLAFQPSTLPDEDWELIVRDLAT
jgi:hypothetical protein